MQHGRTCPKAAIRVRRFAKRRRWWHALQRTTWTEQRLFRTAHKSAKFATRTAGTFRRRSLRVTRIRSAFVDVERRARPFGRQVECTRSSVGRDAACTSLPFVYIPNVAFTPPRLSLRFSRRNPLCMMRHRPCRVSELLTRSGAPFHVRWWSSTRTSASVAAGTFP